MTIQSDPIVVTGMGVVSPLGVGVETTGGPVDLAGPEDLLGHQVGRAVGRQQQHGHARHRRLTGVVDVSTPEFLGVRSAHGLHRIGAEGDAGCGVSAYHYFYGEPVDVETLTKAWDAWLAELFPPPAGG